jgi:hypothetical protein
VPILPNKDATQMSQRASAVFLVLGFSAAFSAVAASVTEPGAPKAASAPAIVSVSTFPHLTAKEIVARNVKARGGLDAWRKVKTMVSIGHLETGNPAAPRVPFVMQQARPNRTRFEVHVHEKTSVRVFNGVEGWKLRPSRGGGSEPVAYTAEEIGAARDGPGIDGPLIDNQAKGIGVEFDGIDEVAGKKAYRLIIKLPSGAIRRWWIDAESFLDVRYERESRTATGQAATVTVSFANYKSVDGLQIPHSIMTGRESGKEMEAMMIEQTFLNRPISDKVFSEPRAPTQMKSASPLPRAH